MGMFVTTLFMIGKVIGKGQRNSKCWNAGTFMLVTIKLLGFGSEKGTKGIDYRTEGCDGEYIDYAIYEYSEKQQLPSLLLFRVAALIYISNDVLAQETITRNDQYSRLE